MLWYTPCDPSLWVRFDGMTVWRYGCVVFIKPTDSAQKIASASEYHPVYVMKKRLRSGFRLSPAPKSRVPLSGAPHPPNMAAQLVRRIYRQLFFLDWLK